MATVNSLLLQRPVLDAAIAYVRTNASKVHLCSAKPATLADVANVSLGSGSNPSIGASADLMQTVGSDQHVIGRKAAVAAMSAGNVTKSGTSTHAVVVSTTEILAVKALTGDNVQPLTVGNPLNIKTFDIEVESSILP